MNETKKRIKSSVKANKDVALVFGKEILRPFFSSKMRVRLLRLFVNSMGRAYYLREISKLLSEPLTPVRRELLNLEKVGFLNRRKAANIIYYEVNNSFIFFPEIKSMIEKTEEIKFP